MYRKWGRTKPPIGSTIDYGHHLAQRLAACWLFNEGSGRQVRSLVNPADAFTVSSLPLWTPNKESVGVKSLGSTSAWVTNALRPELRIPTNLTFVWRGVFHGTAPATTPMCGAFPSIPNGSPFSSWNFYFPSGALGNVQAGWNNGSFQNAVLITGYAIGVIYDLALVVSPTRALGYVNGQLAMTSAAGGNVTYNATAAVTINGDSAAANFSCIQACLYRRVLTAQELAWRTEEPYAFICSPRAVQYFVPQAAPPPSGFNAGRVQRGVVIGGGCY